MSSTLENYFQLKELEVQLRSGNWAVHSVHRVSQFRDCRLGNRGCAAACWCIKVMLAVFCLLSILI